MSIWNDDLLNLPNGDIDLSYVARAAKMRAHSISDRYGWDLDLEGNYSFMMERAGLFRIKIRRDRGLRDDMVMIPMPSDIAAELAKSGVQWEI